MLRASRLSRSVAGVLARAVSVSADTRCRLAAVRDAWLPGSSAGTLATGATPI
jgi:hypothetical protein